MPLAPRKVKEVARSRPHDDAHDAAHAPAQERPSWATRLGCDVCGGRLPQPQQIVWSWYPKGAPTDTASHTQADGMYCSVSCALRDTHEAKGARRRATQEVAADCRLRGTNW
jgi:hypothetical protein